MFEVRCTRPRAGTAVVVMDPAKPSDESLPKQINRLATNGSIRGGDTVEIKHADSRSTIGCRHAARLRRHIRKEYGSIEFVKNSKAKA